MCGIIGYAGGRDVLPVLVDGLRRLSYRGYDSAGVAVVSRPGIGLVKCKGRIDSLEQALDGNPLPRASVGMGHTRWATHGVPADHNAHPHVDCSGRIACVHNGIVENHKALRAWLEERGHTFSSETDTEVIPHLIEHYLGDGDDTAAAVLKAANRLQGSFALVVTFAGRPGELIGFRQDNPLVLGLGEGENFLASDIPALLPYTRRVVVVEDGELVTVTGDGVTVHGPDGSQADLNGRVMDITWSADMAEKGGYEHFMLKEIHEQPRALRDTLAERLVDDGAGGTVLDLSATGLTRDLAAGLRDIHVIACGTAYHAGLVARRLIEKWARIPVSVDVASEFRYREPLVDQGSLLLVISQSGETLDTLAAMREGARMGGRSLAVTNVVGSSVAREADHVLYTWAGPEIAVASTKAYTTQLMGLALVALQLGLWRETLPAGEARKIMSALRDLPRLAEETLKTEDLCAEVAHQLAGHDDVFFIGRGLDYALALEGQLKLKEISYIHAEAYPAGELKHGTLALIEEGTPVIAVMTQPDLRDKMLSNVAEVRARGARVFAVALEGDEEAAAVADAVIAVPRTMPALMAPLVAIPLQLLSYHAARIRGCDIDQPRNLAKSVTVE